MTKEKVVYEYSADTTSLVNGLNKADKSNKNLDSSASSTNNTMKKLGGIVAGIGMASLGKQVFSTGLAFTSMEQSTSKALNILLGSSEAADDLQGKLKEVADNSQFDLGAINDLGVQLLNAGVEAKDVPDAIKGIGNAVGALGGDTEKLKTASLGLTQAYQKGKLQGQDLKQIQEAGIPITKELAKVMGVQESEVSGLASAGKIGKKEMDALFKTMQQDFAGGMDVDTASEKIANMKAQVSEAAGKIVSAFLPAIEGIVTKITEWSDSLDNLSTEKLQEIGAQIVNVLKVVGILALAWIGFNLVLAAYSTIVGIITVAQGLWTTATTVLTAAQWALNLALSPVGIVILLVAAAIAVIIVVIMKWGAITDWLKEKWKQLGEFFGPLWESIKTTFTNALTAIKDFVVLNFNRVKEFIVNLWNGIKAFFVGIWKGIKLVFTTYTNLVKKVVTTVFTAVKNTIESIWNGVKTFFSNVWKGIVNIFKKSVDLIYDNTIGRFTKLVDKIKDLFGGIGSSIGNAFKNIPFIGGGNKSVNVGYSGQTQGGLTGNTTSTTNYNYNITQNKSNSLRELKMQQLLFKNRGGYYAN